ncbi:hypothetical protein INR49_032867 [Caranx melampygus]|nr:hypothetical protein INR49_032867 [Caranx melampygus]
MSRDGGSNGGLGRKHRSGTTSTQVDTEAQDYREHDDEPLNLQEPEGDNRVDSDACPGVVEPVRRL